MRRGSALLAVALLAACTSEPKPVPPVASPVTAQAGDHTLTVTVGDKERTFLLHVPASYDPGRAAPAVVALHHRPGSGTAMRELTGLDAKADAEGFLVAYPEGVGGQFNAFGCCGAQDDVGFVKAVAGRLVESWHADPQRIFLAGVSNGGDLSFRTAVEAPGVFAAIGVVSGGFAGGRTEAADYRPSSPVSVVTLIGADDPQATTFRTGVDTWRGRLACSKPAEARSEAPPTTPAGVHLTTTRCLDGSDVDAYVIDGGAHAWFGAPAGELKDTAAKIKATDVLWSFFAAHPRRR
ncbi:alpha/beta hydrolase family esterase [Dactylosporangium siamense]|uniref:Hydrolase n=1 Tax=Dactylosporangium siamense TaxID=685454 RepID=A0A919PYD2_9ACTN|nr:PHB depolymerase family esterase [Dactylosporangium siamense]GIG51917.1 hydrolase [Dactylosporangium siamense]